MWWTDKEMKMDYENYYGLLGLNNNDSIILHALIMS